MNATDATPNFPDLSNVLLTEAEAARYLGLARATLRNRRWLGHPPTYVKLGQAVRYRVADLDALVTAGLVQA